MVATDCTLPAACVLSMYTVTAESFDMHAAQSLMIYSELVFIYFVLAVQRGTRVKTANDASDHEIKPLKHMLLQLYLDRKHCMHSRLTRLPF